MKNVLLASLIFGLLLPAGLAFADEHGAEPAHAAAGATSATAEELLINLRVPLMSPHFSDMPVALVNEEPITFRDLTRRISAIHTGMEEGETSKKKDYADLLDRVITSQLIVEEALNIGLDELPEVEKQIETVSTEYLISKVMTRELAKVEADPKELREAYEGMSREVKLATVKFQKEEDGLAFEADFESGEAFGELVKRYGEAGRAEAAEPEFMKMKDLLPSVGQAVFEMEAGSISQIFSAGEGFFLFYLEENRFVEDPEIEEEARKMLLAPLKQAAAREYADHLEDKHATVDRGLLRSADFEEERTGFLSLEKKKRTDLKDLMQDERVVATVDIEPPFSVTIGDLAGEVQEVFFHGIETAIEKRDLNDEKQVVLKNMLFKKTVVAEARELGLDQTDEYEDTVGEYTNSVLFNTFVKKVIAPDVTIDEEEVRAYYTEHIDDFSSPKMLRLKSLAFHSLPDAQSALAKVRKGADFKWVSANSAGLVAKETEGVADFEAAPLTIHALPEEIRKQADAAQRGGAILYSDEEGFHYLVVVEKVFPAAPRPYAASRAPIAREIVEHKTRDLIDEWSEKLKEAYETRIFVVGDGD